MYFPQQVSVLADKVFSLPSLREHRGYIVGGLIRDVLLGRETRDVDIAVEGDAVGIAREVARLVKGKFVLLDADNGVARVVNFLEGHDWNFDFSSLYGNIESDLARRDFTINAMAIEIESANMLAGTELSQLPRIDPFHGEEDLKGRVIRAVSPGIFEADPVRLLRAVRLAGELDFAIAPETEKLIQRDFSCVTSVPGERVREEVLRLLSLPHASSHLEYLDHLGLLVPLIPELGECKGVDQPTVHFWNVFDHSLKTVAAIEFLLGQGPWEAGGEDLLATVPWSEEIERHLSREVSHGSDHRGLLKLGGLLHDIAKPQTKFVDDAGRAHFLGHPGQGADMTQVILERLRFSRREIDLVKALVLYHLRPVQLSQEGMPTKRAVYRYFRDTGEYGIDILLLALADHLATYGPGLPISGWQERCHLVDYILEEHACQEVKVQPDNLIDGHILMSTLGISPGPVVGELLAAVREAQASGDIRSREEALRLARHEFDEHHVKQGSLS
ncbi:MAG: HD domain-containing protein [Chloroflexota bacterium]|nr:HD domain-containing protein [Chloroflexota bacterium]